MPACQTQLTLGKRAAISVTATCILSEQGTKLGREEGHQLRPS